MLWNIETIFLLRKRIWRLQQSGHKPFGIFLVQQLFDQRTMAGQTSNRFDSDILISIRRCSVSSFALSNKKRRKWEIARWSRTIKWRLKYLSCSYRRFSGALLTQRSRILHASISRRIFRSQDDKIRHRSGDFSDSWLRFNILQAGAPCLTW